MTPLWAVFLLPWFSPPGPAPTPAPPFVEPSAVLLNLSERSLNRIVVDTFHANGGPLVSGERARVSARVADLRYRAALSEPVLRLGEDGTAHLSMEILEANLRIGQLDRSVDGSGARCEGAGIDVDPTLPLRVNLALGLAVENGALRLHPTSVEIADLQDRLLLVSPTRCTNSFFPAWFLWWVGKPFLRRSVGNLDEILLERVRKSAARLEEKQARVSRAWGEDLHLFPSALDTRGGSLLVGLTASSAEDPPAPAPPPEIKGEGALPSGSFLGISESLANEVARRAFSRKTRFPLRSGLSAQRLLSSEAIYALIPGLRGLDSREQLDLDLSFREAPRLEFDAGPDGQARIRVLVSGVDLRILRKEADRATWLGTLHIESGRMAAVPFPNVLGGISFRVVENRWKTSSSGLAFDDEMVAATLQEIAFGKIFETSYAPLLTRNLHIGDTEFVPRWFTAARGYLIIGLGEGPPLEPSRSPAAATRTDSLLGSR